MFLELETDTGLIGVSEVRMVSRTETLIACLDELAPRHVLGTDPFDVERLAWNIQRGDYDRPGEVSQSALACFDVACWDLIGQSLGVPVWKLIGGKFHARVPAYANGWYQTEREPAKIAALATTVVAKGYRAMKLDPFGHASAELSAARARPRRRDRRGRARSGRPGRRHHDRDARPLHVGDRRRPSRGCSSRSLPSGSRSRRRRRTRLRTGQSAHATPLPIATGERAHTMEDIRGFIEGGVVDVVQVDLDAFRRLPRDEAASPAGPTPTRC